LFNFVEIHVYLNLNFDPNTCLQKVSYDINLPVYYCNLIVQNISISLEQL